MVNSEILGFELQTENSPEAKIDLLMQDYIKSLSHLKNIKNEKIALSLITSIREEFLKRAIELQPQLNTWLSSMDKKQATIYKEQMLIKPYFKKINDLTMECRVKLNLDHNTKLSNEFTSMNQFMSILYN